jgi:hypothetical protein
MGMSEQVDRSWQCRGSIALGSGCEKCWRCKEELARLAPEQFVTQGGGAFPSDTPAPESEARGEGYDCPHGHTEPCTECERKRLLDAKDREIAGFKTALQLAQARASDERCERELTQKVLDDTLIAATNLKARAEAAEARVREVERERDEWKQHAATGVAVRKQELAQHMDALGQLTAAIAERDQAIRERDEARAWAKRWRTAFRVYFLRMKSFGAANWEVRIAMRNKERTITRLEAAARGLAEALEGLVNLKAHKDAHGKDDFYRNNQPLVWHDAAMALAAYHAALAGKENGGG